MIKSLLTNIKFCKCPNGINHERICKICVDTRCEDAE